MRVADVPCLAIAGIVLVLSLLGFAVAVHDKRQARRAGRRVRERSLLLLALAGGWPGLGLGFLLARHKTRKTRFLVPFLLFATLNGALLVLAWRRWC